MGDLTWYVWLLYPLRSLRFDFADVSELGSSAKKRNNDCDFQCHSQSIPQQSWVLPVSSGRGGYNSWFRQSHSHIAEVWLRRMRYQVYDSTTFQGHLYAIIPPSPGYISSPEILQKDPRQPLPGTFLLTNADRNPPCQRTIQSVHRVEELRTIYDQSRNLLPP